jgi:hypothetical protein
MGRRNLFVCRMVSFPDGDFATAADKIKQSGVELIVGSEAELLGKMEQVKGVLPQTDNIEEIWEVENWGEDEWTEQVLAEFAFCKGMNVQFFPDSDNRRGAGYRMRRAPNGLVLVPSDNDEDIFVAVRVERKKEGHAFCARRKGNFHSSIRRIVGSFPRKPCTIWKNFPARNGSGQCHHFKSCRSRGRSAGRRRRA